jgi:hypothetical protein
MVPAKDIPIVNKTEIVADANRKMRKIFVCC